MRSYRDSRLVKIFLVVFFLIVIGYAYYEARGMLFGPKISINTTELTVSDPFVTIKGHADRIASLLMNGRPISVTEDGVFEEPFVLSPGINHVIFEAKDKYGRMSERIVELVLTDAGKLPVKNETAAVAATSTSTKPEKRASTTITNY